MKETRAYEDRLLATMPTLEFGFIQSRNTDTALGEMDENEESFSDEYVSSKDEDRAPRQTSESNQLVIAFSIHYLFVL